MRSRFSLFTFPISDPIAGGPCQAGLDRVFVSYHSGDKTLELADMNSFLSC